MIFWRLKIWFNFQDKKFLPKTFSEFIFNSKNENDLQDLLTKKESKDFSLLKNKESSFRPYDYSFTNHRYREIQDSSFVKNKLSRYLYEYPEGTPLVSNSYFKEKYLSQTSLSNEEVLKLCHLLERRRHLMEWYESYNFNEALQFHILRRDIPLFKEQHPFSSFFYSKLRSTAYLFIPDMMWRENRITHYLLYSRRGPISASPSLVEQPGNRTPWSNYRGVKKYIPTPWYKRKLKRVYYNVKESELFLVNRKSRLLIDKHWTYNDPYHHRYSWIYPPQGFIFENKRNLHRSIAYFQNHDIYAALNEIRKFKRVKRHKHRVEKSWHFLYDKRFTIKEKFLKFVKGDLWLQTKFDTGTLNFTWGDTANNQEAYGDSFLSGQFNLYTHFVTPRWWKQRYNPHVANFRKFAKLDRYWLWIKPKCYGNRVFLEDYFLPWLHFLQKNKQSPWTTFKDPNVFWFKYSHKEFTYLRLANGRALTSDDFGSGSAAARRFEHLFLRVWLSFWNNRPPGVSKYWYFSKSDDFGWSIKVPNAILPEGTWTKYYTYAGPSFWYFDYSLIFYKYFGEYHGPRHLPYGIKYDQFYDLHLEKEAFILFDRLVHYFFSIKVFFFFNLKFLLFIFFIGFFAYLLFDFYTSEVMQMSYCFKVCSKIPDMELMKLVDQDKWLEVMVDWETTEDALERHNLNWFLVSYYLLPFFFVFMFSTFLKLESGYLQLANWYGYFLWLGCFSTIYWIKIFVVGVPLEFITEAENTISPFKYRQVWAEERRKTHDLERAYVQKLDSALEELGVKSYKTSWIYKRMVKDLYTVKK